MSLKKFRNDIQGLRAIAVLTVVIFHAWPNFLPGGFIGVDIFFVISGFLIGDILWREISANTFSLLNFYRKRVRRIFPALFVMLAITLFAGFFLLSPAALKELARTTVSATLFLSNVDFTMFSGYFDSVAETRPLLHTWSLSVEEQFYLFFPFVLLAVLRLAPTQIVSIIGICILLLVGLSEWAVHHLNIAGYFLFPYRAFELLLGAFAAYVAAPKGSGSVAAGIGLTAIALSLVFLSPETPFPGIYALLPTVGAALVLWGGRSGCQGLTYRFLSVRPMLFFGAISYSLYLWHWPLLAYLRILVPDHPSHVLISGVVVMSVLFGWLSWKLVEKPFAAAPVSRAPILVSGISGLVVLSLVGSFVWFRGGFPTRFHPEALAYFASAEDVSPWRDTCHQENSTRVPYRETCVLGAQDASSVELAVWGDSHGTELAAALSERLPLRQITASACPPVIGTEIAGRSNCRSANDEVLDALRSDPSISLVVLAMNRDAYATQDQEPLQHGFKAVVVSLLEQGKKVVILQQLPNPNFDAPVVAGMAHHLGQDPTSRVFSWDGITQDHAWSGFDPGMAELPNVLVFDPVPVLCDDGKCALIARGKVQYFNHTHVSMAGAEQVVSALYPLLEKEMAANFDSAALRSE